MSVSVDVRFHGSTCTATAGADAAEALPPLRGARAAARGRRSQVFAYGLGGKSLRL